MPSDEAEVLSNLMGKFMEKSQQLWTTRRPDEQTRWTIKRLCSKETERLAHETLSACQMNMLWRRYGRPGSLPLHLSFFRAIWKDSGLKLDRLGFTLCSAAVKSDLTLTIIYIGCPLVSLLFKSCKLGGCIRAVFTKYITHFWWFLIWC